MNSHRPRHSPVNWIKRIDEQVQQMRQATTWDDLSCFLKVRHPSLRPPTDCPEFWDSVRHQLLLLSKYTPDVLKGTSPKQREQLAALVLDSIGELDSHIRDSADAATDNGTRWMELARAASDVTPFSIPVTPCPGLN